MNSKNEPLVSIIIVNYNGKAHLKKCLDSIKENLYKEYEIILVDNNSTDGNSLWDVCYDRIEPRRRPWVASTGGSSPERRGSRS